MSHIRVLICRVDDPDGEQMTELAAFDFPTADTAALKPETGMVRKLHPTNSSIHSVIGFTINPKGLKNV